MTRQKLLYIVFLIGLLFICTTGLVQAQDNIYYVSTTDGNDSYDGLSTATPFETIAFGIHPVAGTASGGGHDMTFSNNIIDGANHFGVTGYVAESIFEDNEIKNIALIKNLNKSAMGCGITRGECTENGDGFRIIVESLSRIYLPVVLKGE